VNRIDKMTDKMPVRAGAKSLMMQSKSSQIAPGRLRASRPAVLRPRREVLSLHWACERAGNARRADIPGSMAWS
jgi:hypothetical protein